MATFGIDTGGTFTDLVRVDERGSIRVHKVPSTPDDPGRAVLTALAAMGGAVAGDLVVHGTTVALNALLTGRTARTALVTNEGFRDALEIGRQTRPDIYALEPRRTPALVPRELRFELAQRSFPDRERAHAGAVDAVVETTRPSDADLVRLRERLRRARVESVAVCLLHAYADPSIEERVAVALAPLGVPVTCSAALLREHREYERFTTATVNAALVPLMRRYLAPLAERVLPARLVILQSSGGHLSAAAAGDEPVRVLTSGPAGGVVGARAAGRDAGHPAIVALDMGGTSTDVAFAHTGADTATEPARIVTDLPQVGGHPIAVPSLDLTTIGCGGGSLVHVDAAGVLHVGPHSAGADPGPVCHGRSDALTVTDAHAFLGHLSSGNFVEGALELDIDATVRAFERLGAKLGVRPERAALAVLAAARAAMRRAIAAMTHQRGHDPTRLPLVAFGGAGGLHAAALADSLHMPSALVPEHPGALSALGMTRCGAQRESVRTMIAPLARFDARTRQSLVAELTREVRSALDDDPSRGPVHVGVFADLRYRGQAYELRLPDSRDLAGDFHRAHERFYGHRLGGDTAIDLVALRVVAERGASAAAAEPVPVPRRRRALASARTGERKAHFPRAPKSDVWSRNDLLPGHVVSGRAIVEEYSGTTLVPPGWEACVAGGGHLVLRRS